MFRFILILVLCGVSIARADLTLWPTQPSQWVPFTFSGGVISDPAADVNPASVDIVGNNQFASGFLSYQTNNTDTLSDDELFVRLRVNGTGAAHAYQTWFDTDGNSSTWEWGLQLHSGFVELLQAVVTGPTLGDLTLSGTAAWRGPSGGYAQSFVPVDDGSTFGGDPDFFIVFGIPYSAFQSATGTNPNTPISIAFSSSTSGSNINKDFPANGTSSTLLSSVTSDPSAVVSLPEPSGMLYISITALWALMSRANYTGQTSRRRVFSTKSTRVPA